MAAEAPRGKPQSMTGSRPAPSRPMGPVKTEEAVAVVIALIVLYYIVTWVLNFLAVTYVNGPTSVTLTAAPSLLYIAGSEYTANLISVSSSSAAAKIQITKLPAFVNPSLQVSLYLNNNTNINTTGQYANIQIRLTGITNRSVQLIFAPLLATFQYKPDSGRVAVIPLSLYDITTGRGSAPTPTSSTTSLISTTSTTTTGTTSQSTTTIMQGGAANVVASSLLQRSVYYPYMVNYTKLYSNTSSCNAGLYNSTYTSKYGHAPSGVNTYQNVSALIPYKMNLTIANTTAANYTGTWTTTAKTSAFTGTAAIVRMNVLNGGSITSTTLTGIFLGSNTMTLQNGLTNANRVGNACGILVTSCGPC